MEDLANLAAEWQRLGWVRHYAIADDWMCQIKTKEGTSNDR